MPAGPPCGSPFLRIDLDDASSIAIDGPAASGKTAVGMVLAKRMGYRFLDTGAMYRAVTLAAVDRAVDLGDGEALGVLVSGLDVQIVCSEGGDRLLISGVDVTDRLRDREVDRGVSLVASVPGVRSALVRLQREIGAAGSIVMVGRDIGTVVLPHAGTKVFLTASVHTRARRRYREIEDLGKVPDFRRLVDEIQRRDKIDSERADSPLRPADDALVLETDALSVHEVVERILLRAGNS